MKRRTPRIDSTTTECTMPIGLRVRLFEALFRLKQTNGKNRHIQSARRRMLSIQRLEVRQLLATITWDSTKASGFWDVPSNWVGGVVPGANDDVVIGTQSVTYRTGTTTVKSITAQKDFELTGGTLTGGTITQNAGVFNLSGGTVAGVLSKGIARVTAASKVDDFVVGKNTNLDVPSGMTLTVNQGKKLTISGRGDFGDKSTITLDSSSVGTTIFVDGVLNTNGSTIRNSANSFNSTYLEIGTTGRLEALNSIFATNYVLLAKEATLTSGTWSGNTFNTALRVPWQSIKFLSLAQGGRDNVSFNEIQIYGDTLPTNTTLDLSVIGTSPTANANLVYSFISNFTVPKNSTLNINAGVKAYLYGGVILTISGEGNFLEKSIVTLEGLSSTISVDGVLNTNGTTIDKALNSTATYLKVSATGKLNAINSTFIESILDWTTGSDVQLVYQDGKSNVIRSNSSGGILDDFRNLEVKYGSSVSIPQPLRVGANNVDPVTFKVSYSSSVSVGGNLTGFATDTTKIRLDGKVIFNSSSVQDIERWSEDRGPVNSGFINNFAFGTMSLENRTNLRVNTASGGKALYINTLSIEAGSRFNASNQWVYVRKLINNGNIVNGSFLVVVPDGGPLAFSTPTPGEVTASQSPAYDEWTFTASQNGPVSVAVNPGSTGVTAAASPQIKRVRVELRDNAGALLKFIESTTDGNPIFLESDSLTQGNNYRIRVLSMAGSVVTGNYVVTLLNAGTAETGLSIAPSTSESVARAEGTSGSTPYKYTITRTGDLTVPTTVAWSVAGSGSKGANAADFVGGAFPSGVLSFAANDTSNTREITINVAGDTVYENDEAFAVTLSNPSSRSAIVVGTAISQITNDDVPFKSDLIVSSITPPTFARSGQSVSVGWTERNDGLVPISGDWSTNLKVTRRLTGAVMVDRSIPFTANSLASKATVDRTATFDLPDGESGTGDFDIAVTVDSANNIAEENTEGNAETNNRITSSFTATMGNYPELSVSQIQQPSSNVQLSKPFNVTWTVFNSGTGPLTKATSDRIYLSKDAVVDSNDRILATVSSSNVAANASYTKTTSVTLPLDLAFDLGEYQIIVVSDYLNDQFELNENNNQRTSAVTVELPALPDLIVDSISTKEVTVSGQSVDLSWTIKNQGSASAVGSWTDRVYLSRDDMIGDDIPLDSFPVPGGTTIAANGSIIRTQKIKIPASVSGVLRFVVATDTGNTIGEFNNEGNNVSIDDATITIEAKPSPNLIVTSVTSLTNGLSSGQPATIDWIVRNVGNTATSGGWFDAVYLSNNPTLSDDDEPLGKVQNPAGLNEDWSYRSTLTASLPDGVQGNYYFIVVTDSNRELPETGGENDNVATSLVTAITLTPPPDLRVTTITHPREAIELNSIKINWTVLNDGTGTARPSTWSDEVWLSINNDVIDAGDERLLIVPHNGSLASKEEYQVLQQTLTLPLNQFKERAYLIVRTDSGKQVFEHSFEGNNDRASEIRIFQRPLPDLEVESIVPVPFATAGQPLTVSYTVLNASVNATAESRWQDSIYLSKDKSFEPDTDLLLDTRPRTGKVLGNQSESKSYSFRLEDTISGDYYIIVAADSGNQVKELFDTNNFLVSAQPTTIKIAPPDLAITSIGTSTNPKAGRDMTVSYTVTNLGNSPTPDPSWNDGIYLSDDNQWDKDDERLSERQRTGVLAPQQSANRSITVSLPPNRFGAAYIIVRSDSSDSVYELNEANNYATAAIQIGDDRPDLRVESFSLRSNIREVAPGGQIAFDFEVANRGQGGTFGRTWIDRLVLSSDLTIGNADDVNLGTITIPADVAAGRSYFRLSESVAVPRNTVEKQYRLYLVTDATNAVGELDETNNLSIPIDLVVTSNPTGGNELADLVITDLTVPSTAKSGASMPIRWTVQNNGVAVTSKSYWQDTVWLSTDGSIDGNDVLVGRYPRDRVLAPGASYTRSVDWPVGIDLSGDYFTIVQTDSANTIAEGPGEANNKRVSAAITSIELSPVADLQVASISVPATAFAGRTLSTSWTVTNAGAGTAMPTWSDNVYLSLDQIFDKATDIPIGYANRESQLSSNQPYTVTTDFSLPPEVGGSYYVIVLADVTNRVYERLAEDNNIGVSSQPVVISHLPPADLVVGDIVVPSTAALGQSASITYTITNAGQDPARGGWYDAVFISSDEIWDIDDGYMGRVWRAGDVAAGGSYTTTLTAPLPGVVPGNYKVIVRSDIRNNLVEWNEQNNLKASLDRFATDAPALVLGTPTVGNIAVNQSIYYKVIVPAGETVVVEFDSASDEGATELYMSYESMPRRSRADLNALKPFQTDQRIVISSTQGGTYYILAYGSDVTAPSSSFSILARIVPFTVFDTNFGQGGTAGNRTILVDGAKFDRSVTATLVDSQGRTLPAVAYTRVNDTRLYASFDLRDAAIANYSLRFSKGSSGEQIVVADAFEVVFSIASVQPISLTRPDAFNRRRNDRAPAIIPVSLGWRNNTLNDVAVPLIHFSATDPFALTLEDTNPEAKPGRTVTSTEFLGFSQTDGPRDILLPGDSASATFFVAPRSVLASEPPMNIYYVAEYFYNDSQAIYNWDYDLSQLDLSYLTDDEAIEAITAFKQARGSTLGSLRQVLAEGLQRAYTLSPANVPDATRFLIQEVFDRFVADRQTSLRGVINFPSLSVDLATLAITISEVGGARVYTNAVLADGSFVFPKLAPATYAITVTGGSIKAAADLRVTVMPGDRANIVVSLEVGPATVRANVPARTPMGTASIAAPWLIQPGKIDEPLTGNVLKSVLDALGTQQYRVELVGDAPIGFSIDPNGVYRFHSSETVAFVVHYDLVLKDVQTRVGRLFGSEIRSRGALAITLKNNFTLDLRSLDPNDIVGPDGYGDEKWVSPTERLAYKIRYENDRRNATSAALSVNITQTLDSDLDPRSFEFGDFGFGGRLFKAPGKQAFSMEIDLKKEMGIIVGVLARLDAASGKISWTFTTISPTTNNESTNPKEGFLPRNEMPPQGDGFVSYTVLAKKSSATGSKIHAEANIVFDGNVPIVTPQIFNTLDASKPESTIASAESIGQGTKVLVKWAGSDGDVGAGVSTYDVYVSEDNGRYRFLKTTPLTELQYEASPGLAVSFLTIVRDNVGNLESDVKFPDNKRPTSFVGGPYKADEGKSIVLQGSGSAPDETKTFSYEWDLDYDGKSFQIDSQSATPTLTVGDGPSVRTVGLRVRNSGADSLVSPVASTTVNIVNVAPELTVQSQSVRGNVGTVLLNSGTYGDFLEDVVSLSASVGSVEKKNDGTWAWNFTPTVGTKSQSVTITAKDNDNASRSVSFTYSANSIPTGIQLSNRVLVEKQPIGSTVGKLSTDDPDSGDTFAYSLVAGSGDADNGLFTIVNDELRSARVFNVTQDTDFSVRVRSEDQDKAGVEQVFVIRVTREGESNTDFGDAPSGAQSGFIGNYPTTIEQNGARHRIGALRLGAAIDAERYGINSAGSMGDDTTGVDDEDGIRFATPIYVSSTTKNEASIVVTSSGDGKLDGWIDFNRDGDWDDAKEKVLISSAVVSGSQLVSFEIPAGAMPGTSYARFRLSTAGALTTTGIATDGEVEDYEVALFNANQSGLNLNLHASDLGQHQLLIVDGQLMVRNTARTVFSVQANLVNSVQLLNTAQNAIYRFDNPTASLFGILDYKDFDKPVVVNTGVATLDLAQLSGQFSGVNVIDTRESGATEIRITPAAVTAINREKSVKLLLGNDDRLVSQGVWRFDSSRLEASQLVQRFTSNGSVVDIQSQNKWQNPINKYDVNKNGTTDPLDVLVLINQINASSGSQSLPEFDPAKPNDFQFMDVNADGGLGPLDVLEIINAINSGNRFGEGESAQDTADRSLGSTELTDMLFASSDAFFEESDWRQRVRRTTLKPIISKPF